LTGSRNALLGFKPLVRKTDEGDMIIINLPQEGITFFRFSWLTAAEYENYLSLNLTQRDLALHCL
jgi:hypothetical protein